MRSDRKRRPNWSKLTAAYLTRTCSQEEFCKRHGVSSSTLSYQVNKAGRRPKFLPQLELSPEIVLELPAGVKLTIRR